MSENFKWGRPARTASTDWMSSEETVTAILDSPVEVVELRFAELAEQWLVETAAQSSLAKRHAHPAYQSIVGLGPAVVPVLLSALEASPNYWFHALRAITREDPVTQEMRGNLRAMSDAWLAWGRARGYSV
jgi:hypothetical protein